MMIRYALMKVVGWVGHVVAHTILKTAGYVVWWLSRRCTCSRRG